MQFLKSVKTTNAITLKVVSFVLRFFYWHSRQPNSLLTGLWNTLLLCLQCHDATWPFLSFHFFKAWHYKNSCGQAHVDVHAQMKQTQTELRAGHSGSTISWAFLFPLCSRSLGNHDKMEEMKLIRKVWYLLNVHRQQQDATIWQKYWVLRTAIKIKALPVRNVTCWFHTHTCSTSFLF